jgi:hypothetical protein
MGFPFQQSSTRVSPAVMSPSIIQRLCPSSLRAAQAFQLGIPHVERLPQRRVTPPPPLPRLGSVCVPVYNKSPSPPTTPTPDPTHARKASTAFFGDRTQIYAAFHQRRGSVAAAKTQHLGRDATHRPGSLQVFGPPTGYSLVFLYILMKEATLNINSIKGN